MKRHFILLISVFITILEIMTGASMMPTVVDALSTKPKSKPAAAAAVAVLGSTGRLGQQTVRQLINLNIPVKCLVRPSSIKNLPKEWIENNEPLVEIIKGELLLLDENNNGKPTLGIDNAEPTPELIKCLNGCNQCIAVYGSTRRTKINDLFNFNFNRNKQEIEDIDPIHAKQINYRSIQALLKACVCSSSSSSGENSNNNCKHIIRITGKGEDPTGKVSILINLLGSFAKAWNYEGEELLRNNQYDIGYTIIRPGIMKDEITITTDKKKNDDDDPAVERYLELADDGGNDLKVSAVEYKEIGELITEIVVQVTNDGDNKKLNSNNRRVTLAAMNVEGSTIPKEEDGRRKTLKERVLVLRNDRRDFPKSLIAEHKSAVYGFAKKLAIFGIISIVSLIYLIVKASFAFFL